MSARTTRSRSRLSGPGAPAGLLAGIGLVAIGAGLLFLASTAADASVRAARAAVPVNPGAAEGRDTRAHNSPTLARNPRNGANLVAVDRVDSPQYSCAMYVTADGGAAWQETRIPFPAGEELPERCFAPDASFTPDGTLYVSFVTLGGTGNSPNAVWVSSSTDGGRTLTTPVKALGPNAFQVRLLADSVRPGHLYLSWLQADALGFVAFQNPGNPVRFMRSTDGGGTWSDPISVNPPERARVIAPSLAQGRDNELFMLYLDVGDDRLDYHGAHEWMGGEPYGGTWQLVLSRSGNRGDTWTDTVVDDEIVPTQRLMIFLPPSPSVAVDRERGLVHVAFHDARSGDADVLLWRSNDRGTTFGPPRRVNDNSDRDGTSQYLPRLAVSPDGRLDIAYYDRRRDPADVLNEVSFQSSFDQGDSFTPSERLSDRQFDSRIGFGGDRGMPDLGTRLGLVADDDRSLVAWSDTRRGTADAVRQDLAVARLAVTAPSSWKDPLLAAGTAVMLLGVVIGFVGLVRGRRASAAADPGVLAR